MSNITPGHVRVFQALRSPAYDNFTLASCTINGERGVAIVMMGEMDERDRIEIAPLFVAITPGMKIVIEGQRSADGEEGGGPKDENEEREAQRPRTAQEEVTRPAPR